LEVNALKEIIATQNAPGAIGPYSQGICIGNVIYTSGQIPINIKTGEIPLDIKEQAFYSLSNVKAILEANGATMSDIVKTTVFITDISNFSAINEVYATFFEGSFPARSCVEVAKLPKDAGIEIEAIAIKA